MSPAKATAKKKVKVEEPLTPVVLKAALEKHFGVGSVKMGNDPSLEIRRISTGVLSVDEQLRGGLARGRHIEIYGDASVGKTTLAYYIIAAAQALGFLCAFVDTEKTFDPVFAAHVGVVVEDLYYHEQKTGPRCIDFVDTLVKSKMFAVIVCDSVASLVPAEDLETDMEAGSYGMQQAKMMSKGLRKTTAGNTNQGTMIVWLNQTREKIGVTFGKKTTTSGGRAMGFYASTRIEMNRIETLVEVGKQVDPQTGEIKEDKRVPHGHRIQVVITKDKTGSRPMGKTTIVFDYRRGGFDHLEDLIYCGLLYGLVHKSGNSWWVDGYEKKKAGSRKNFKKFLRKNEDIADELEEWIRNSFEVPGEFDDDDD